MKTRTLGLVLVTACGAVASVAMADETDVRAKPGTLKQIGDRKDSPLFNRTRQNGTFGDRATIDVIVYDNTTNVGNAANFAQASTLATCSHILEDVSFANGPYQPSFTGSRQLTYFTYHYFLNGGTASWDIRHSYYRPSDVNFSGFSGDGSGMVNPNASPYFVLTLTGFDTNLCPGFGGISNFVAFNSPVAVPAGDAGLVLDAAYVEPGTPGTAPLTSTNLFQTNITTTRVAFLFGTNTLAPNIDTNPGTAGVQPPAGAQTEAFLSAAGNPSTPGYTHPQYGRDTTFDASFLGQSLVNSGVGTAPNINERRYTSTGRTLGFTFGLAGSVEAPAAIPAQSLNDGEGFLADGIVQVNDVLTPAAPFKWYKFDIKNDISYTNVSFLDIDTEGSSSPVSFAVYTPNSAVFDFGESRGSGPDTPPSQSENNAFQISYGVARRPGVGNGVQYSGQEGTMPAGQYYLIVAPAGSGFGDGWATNAATAANINFTLNINGNPKLTLPAGPAVSPTLPTGGDLGILLGGPQVASGLAVPPRGVSWVRFGLTNNIPTVGQFDQRDQITPLSDVTFMDITQPGSSIVGEWNFALYNNNGVAANGTSVSLAGAGFNNNNGGGDGPFGCGGSFAQLSYGTEPSRGFAPLDAGHTSLGLALNNQNGSSLGNDEYYLAVTMGTALFAGDRWGARSTRGSNLTAVITVNSNNRGPSAGCPADFNGDGGVDDADFVTFARAYNNLIDLVGDINLDTFSDDSDFALFSAAYDALLCP